MNDYYQYGNVNARVKAAAGVKGILLRTLDGAVIFRVHDSPEHFADYEIRHDDLSITIDADALAAFYEFGERRILDHSPEVLGLKKVEGR